MSCLKTLINPDGKTNTENAVSFMRQQNEMNLTSSFEGTQLSVIKATDDQLLFDAINNLLYATSMALNVKEKLNAFQAFDLVHMIINDWPFAKFEQLVYLFKQGKRGDYGPHYNKLDIETVTHWLNSFFNGYEYLDYLEKLNQPKVEEVELNEEQKQNWQDFWKNVKDNFTTFAKDKKGQKAAVVNRVSVNVFHERFKTYAKELTDDELRTLISEYSKEAPDYVKIIETELNTRTNEKRNS